MDFAATPSATQVQERFTETLIARLTPGLGVIAAMAAFLMHRKDWAAGLLVGAALAWLNFRWLRRGLDGLVAEAQAQAGQEKPRVSIVTYLLVLIRYSLIALIVYVIFVYLHIPLVSMLVGLCALGAAAIAASVYEIFRPVK
ncbi:MAG TPA: ATP synthase subunit I [Candidatus Dormibacteraeota bacterium]|nr:ATP synthase subunit I [Candidatus Dormibacteraeota bacterium]